MTQIWCKTKRTHKHPAIKTCKFIDFPQKPNNYKYIKGRMYSIVEKKIHVADDNIYKLESAKSHLNVISITHIQNTSTIYV